MVYETIQNKLFWRLGILSPFLNSCKILIYSSLITLLYRTLLHDVAGFAIKNEHTICTQDRSSRKNSFNIPLYRKVMHSMSLIKFLHEIMIFAFFVFHKSALNFKWSLIMLMCVTWKLHNGFIIFQPLIFQLMYFLSATFD